jgi:hypothetical protein
MFTCVREALDISSPQADSKRITRIKEIKKIQ